MPVATSVPVVTDLKLPELTATVEAVTLPIDTVGDFSIVDSAAGVTTLFVETKSVAAATTAPDIVAAVSPRKAASFAFTSPIFDGELNAASRPIGVTAL